ncbi:hypothetical protein CYCD_18610 [Tenuifilaceae bacterium CYCD]|nr:hypothetical protein CYCD_18610 [Tenuifilaceae bacterium CYCD]
MKKFLLTVFISSLALLGIAQTDGMSLDTIILVSSKKIIGKVQSVGSSKITYLKPETQQIEEITRKQIHKIKYSSGRVEAFNSMAFQELDATNFQSVIITENPADVDGLYAYGEIESKSGTSSKTAKAAEKNARIRLQRKAAAMGALYVLITSSETRGGYKEVPTHYYKGIAYGIDPPKEGQKK